MDYFSPTGGALPNWSTGNSYGFPDPFTDYASIVQPETMIYAHRWCEYIVLKNGAYRTALERVLSYFITDIDVSGVDDDVQEKYKRFLSDTLGIYNVLHRIGFDYLTYGNAFISVLMPFKRYLICPTCFMEHPLNVVHDTPDFKFEWSNFEFHATCPRCQYRGKWRHQDRRGGADGVRIKRWNIHEMEIRHDQYSEECSYLWKIPADYKQQIRKGTLYQLERVPMEVIDAIKNDQYLSFDKDTVFHLKEEALCGIRNRGWGISRVLSNFCQAWYVQVLHRYNEAIALDYIIPFRVITPAAQGGGGNAEAKDPVFNFGMGGFVGRVNAMLRKRKRDPAGWNIMPFPIEYKALGGDAKALVPVDLMNQGIELLLNNVGVPVELFKGSLTIQAAPPALRLFESHWSHLVHVLNRLLRYLSFRVATLLSWDRADLKLERVSTSDDLSKQQAKLQLMVSHLLSQTTGLKSIGVDWRSEFKKQLEEQRYQAEQQQKAQDAMDRAGLQQQVAQGVDPTQQQQQAQQQQQGGGGGGGDDQPPPPPSPVEQAMASMPSAGNNLKISPQELLEKAQVLGQQLLGKGESERASQLMQLKKSDPVLHDLVRSNMDKMRTQARSQGGAMLMQQQFGQQQGG